MTKAPAMKRGVPKSLRALSARESTILDLVRQGHTNKQIAAQLGISCYTVRDHVSSLLLKSGLENRTALAAAAGTRAAKPKAAHASPTEHPLHLSD